MTQQQVTALQESIPAQGSGSRAPQTPPHHARLSPIVEGFKEEAVDETLFEAEDDDKSSYRTMDEANPLQQLLEQFEKARVQERRLRKQELSELVAAIKAPLPPRALSQHNHWFKTHQTLPSMMDPQDKVHLAAPHLIGEAVTWYQHWADKHTDPLTHTTKFHWDIFVSDFKQRFLPEYLTALEDEFAELKQKGMPVLSYSNKLLTLAQHIGTTEKEKLRAFSRGLDASIKHGVRNLKPATYEEALELAQNKELELNNGKPKQPTSSTSSQQTNGRSQANKTAKPNTPSKPKMTPDEKAKTGVIGGYLTPEEQKAYMAKQRCFGCHVKGHRKQDCAKWKEK
ncbi:hypothetical protein L7F22_006572 [Adiantum nelumboides]|nr:hypothetical protein [Adiantum nelumboides]